MSVVVKVARHCLYLPEGSPAVTGAAPPTVAQLGLGSPLANGTSLALTSKVMPVQAGKINAERGIPFGARAVSET